MQLERLKEWRESRGLTQKELAEKARVGEVTVARTETGASIRPNTARKMAEALGVEVPDLLGRPPMPAEYEPPKAEAPSRSGQPEISEEEQRSSGTPPPQPPEFERAVQHAAEVRRLVRQEIEAREGEPTVEDADRHVWEATFVLKELLRHYTPGTMSPRAFEAMQQSAGQWVENLDFAEILEAARFSEWVDDYYQTRGLLMRIHSNPAPERPLEDADQPDEGNASEVG